MTGNSAARGPFPVMVQLAHDNYFSLYHLFLPAEGRHGRGRLRSRAVLQEEQEGHDREQPEDG